jgi:hypothetical protein
MSSTLLERPTERGRGVDVRIEVRFVGSAFSASLVANVITALEESAYQAEVDEIGELQRLLPDVDAAVFDAMRFRATRYRGRAVSFESARPGSMILIGILAGLSYWLLDKTLGETVKEAWVRSGRHEEIVKILSERRWRRAEAVTKRIEPRPYPFTEPKPHVTARVEEAEGAVTAVVTVEPDPLTEQVPSAEQVIEGLRHRGKR